MLSSEKLLHMRAFLNNRQIDASWQHSYQAKAPFHQHWGTSFPNSQASALSTCLSKVCCYQRSLSPSAPDAALDIPLISTFQGRVSDCDTACHATTLLNQSYYLDNPSNANNSSGKFQRVQPTTLAELSTPFAQSGYMLIRLKKPRARTFTVLVNPSAVFMYSKQYLHDICLCVQAKARSFKETLQVVPCNGQSRPDYAQYALPGWVPYSSYRWWLIAIL